MDDTPCTYRISVKAIITDAEGRILLSRESDGNWEFPGGGLDHGEDPRAGLEREICEETGFTADWISKHPVAFWTIRKEVGSPTLKWFAFLAYEVKVSGDFKPDTSTNDAAREIRYFTHNEAIALKLHDNIKPYFSV